ncbi:esterase-like activity of phytase family protein [Paenibacillus sp. SYP-B3998]|uniref:Esterase-like activity of phytase family protein n=1 Tax=Paenibacillus sp. SYP-B3998 TaxID=2678564 RepID=A0A6G4A4A7_9BACL|nr:esterase-like activity of phytase family protein [Paenibacillus sp. SYP-B3998]NEW08774.1 esterase-like activity of phytase family protein [Paenibacillus sp. SYP-B3998]
MKRLLRKKRMIVLLTAAFAVSGATVVSAGQATLEAVTAKFQITTAGKALTLDKDPVVIDGSTYVPLRTLSEALGKQVEWNEWNQTIGLKDIPKVTGKFEWKNAPALGKGIQEGGFSGLVHLPNDAADTFYTLADRGPNGEVGKDKLRTFPIDAYNPRIYKFKIKDGSIEILDTIKLQLPDGKLDKVSKSKYITGLPNLVGSDEVPYDEKGGTKLSYDPDGLDLEGIAYSPSDDTFWLSEEYRPSVLQVKRDGTIIGRYVPKGAKDKLVEAGAQTPIYDILPEIYNTRISNRGFEGVTISPDGKYLYTSIQSPMANPDKKTGEASRNLRILKMDLATKQVIGEYVYVAEQAGLFTNVKQKDVVISDLSALSSNVMLVDERDKNAGADAQLKRIYKADFSKATNVLGTETSKKLESLTIQQLKDQGIQPISKELVVDIAKLGYPYEKIEGLAVVDKNTIAIVNDNDFGISYDDKGSLIMTGIPTQLQLIQVTDDLSLSTK